MLHDVRIRLERRRPDSDLVGLAETLHGHAGGHRADDLVAVVGAGLIGRAWAVNAVNPKGTVFFLAVVPQFINLQQPLLPQYLVIGLTLSFTDLVVMGGYTALASRILRSLRSEAHVRTTNRVFGVLFIVAGTFLALFKRGA